MSDREPIRSERSGRAWMVVTPLWGFAEATLFFIVPDVLLTWLALERPKRAFLACLLAVAGAIAGGAWTYQWAANDAEAARSALERLPGIDATLIERVASDLDARGLEALVLGPARGVPYKVYAVGWGTRGGDLATFLAVSLPARLVRFVALALLAAGLRRLLLARWSLGKCRTLHIGAWIAFYAWYFRAMSG